MNSTSDLFMAILSMDAYDRSGQGGTPAALVLPPAVAAQGSGIGDASVAAPIALSDIPGDSFFAAVYSWNGQTVISCRGTDNYSRDSLSCWATGAGHLGAQAHDAAAPYLNLNGNSATPHSNFILTGDSRTQECSSRTRELDCRDRKNWYQRVY